MCDYVASYIKLGCLSLAANFYPYTKLFLSVVTVGVSATASVADLNLVLMRHSLPNYYA